DNSSTAIAAGSAMIVPFSQRMEERPGSTVTSDVLRRLVAVAVIGTVIIVIMAGIAEAELRHDDAKDAGPGILQAPNRRFCLAIMRAIGFDDEHDVIGHA